ncbi:Phosphorus acquisition-controlling protein like [Verticillium longisporum]|nr:Phosphorus acquisition-controlling protein like [Verticillium longisporum]
MLPKSALLEISKSESESADKKDGKGGATPNSKASTVEMAIDYIKQLKQEVADANKRAEEAERKLELKQASPPGETR